LSLGTGANATVFSFVNALLLRPVAGVPDPASLVAVYTSDFSSGPYGDSSYPDYVSLKSEATAFASLAAYAERSPVLLRAGENVERVRPAHVSGEFFDVLRLQARGRPGSSDRRTRAPRLRLRPSSRSISGSARTPPTRRSSARRSSSTAADRDCRRASRTVRRPRT
jgi:hypothetical protein